jgi:hypothetical protein
MTASHVHAVPDRFPAAVENHTRKLKPASRPLRDEEIVELERRGNVCEDWALVRVAERFAPTAIAGCHFIGPCYLGFSTANPEDENHASRSSLPAGVYFSTITDSVIEAGAAVHRCPIVDGYRVRSGAIVIGTSLRCAGTTSFGNGTAIEPGIETGGRQLTLLADLDLATVLAICRPHAPSRPDPGLVAAYVERATAGHGYVGAGAVISDCSAVEDSWIGDGATISGATLVSRSTVLASLEDPTTIGAGSIVRDSVLHPGVEVTDGGLVDHSLMLEHSHVERHGKLTAGVLGPNSGVAEGEATACIIGPFTAFHHQALLIAAYWPAGKGNVGYGANVGSNHTSRLPDQEIWPGEGMFFGLGCNVKFPADFSRSPYSIISTSVTTLPQRLEMPFSVITTPVVDAQVPPGIMQLIPGWVLRENIYALLRNEAKYRKRNKARNTPIATAVFREEIVADIRRARDHLASPKEVKDLYLPGEIPGIGKNFVTEADRLAGIEVFDRYIEYFVLDSTARPFFSGEGPRAGGSPPGRPKPGPAQQSEIADEPSPDILVRYLEHRRRMMADARRSREKDWRRGTAYIDDYEQTHPAVDQDELIISLEKEMAGWEALVAELVR